MNLTVEKSAALSHNEKARLKFEIKEIHYEHDIELDLNGNNRSSFNIILDLDKTEYPLIELWWPAGYGKQNLYDFSLEIESQNSKTKKQKTIGFRKVELVQEKVQPEGLTFYFRINNKSVFIKGSNWIPADLFQEKISSEYLEWLFKSAVDANMNVLRVWGGGVYESEQFYKLADRMGIMIWQDFMFACSTYPTNEDYLMSVKKEVEYQVNRLRNHPSIVVWAANNENEAALATNWYQTDKDFELYARDFRKLYIDTIMKIVISLDAEQSRPFLSSSPTNGLRSEQESPYWIAKNPYDLKYGDLHFYDYKMNTWEWKSYPVPRFMSEFGVQSLPSYATLSDKYKMPDDANIFSKMNEHRQHHENGNQEIVNEIQMNLKLSNINDRVSNFKAMIYLSQINQAMTLKTGSELYRRFRNALQSNSTTGLCMGTMYWQFNDVWQAPTWSSIEFISNEFIRAGKWKMSHYYIKKAYTDFLLSPFINDTKIDIFAANDYDSKIETTAFIKIFSYDSMVPKYEKKIELEAAPAMSMPVISIDLQEIEKLSDCAISSNESCMLIVEWTDPVKKLQDSNFLFFQNRLADVTNLRKSNLKIVNFTQESKDLFTIELETDQVALFVWLDIESSRFYGTFSDNGFHMTDSSRVQINYKLESKNVSLEEIKQNLSVKTLANIYFANE